MNAQDDDIYIVMVAKSYLKDFANVPINFERPILQYWRFLCYYVLIATTLFK